MKEKLLRDLVLSRTVCIGNFLSYMGCELTVHKEWCFTCKKDTRRVCCGFNHPGCSGFKLLPGSSVFVRNHYWDKYSLHEFHEFIIETEDGEFLISINRMLNEIEDGYLKFN